MPQTEHCVAHCQFCGERFNPDNSAAFHVNFFCSRKCELDFIGPAIRHQIIVTNPSETEAFKTWLDTYIPSPKQP